MKLILSLLLLITTLTGCKQDFDITSEYKEVPVVYGLLNQQENIHYIRIQKAFLVAGNALVAAGIADSVYYPDNALTVKLIPYLNGSVNGSPITLTRVDGDALGLPKETGTFANSPNILYRFTGSLDPNKRYKLQVTNTTNNFVFETKKTSNQEGIALVKDFQILVPSKAAKLNIQNNAPAKAIWNTAENAGIYDLSVRFHYREYNQSDNSLRADTFADIFLYKSLIQDYGSGSNIQAELTADVLLKGLSNKLEARSDVYREFNNQKGMVFTFSVGGTDLAAYINSQQAQSGLTSNEALPPYSNISPIGQAVGLFSSRYVKQVDSVLLSNNGLDTLSCSTLSSALRFKNHSGLICQ